MSGSGRRTCPGLPRRCDGVRPTPRRLARRGAEAKPSTLAYWLANRSVLQLAERLGCDARAAARLKLCGTPSVMRWRADVDAIALWLGLEPRRLAPVLVETEANSPVRTYPVTRGILAVAAASRR